jgi:hypothetical protein
MQQQASRQGVTAKPNRPRSQQSIKRKYTGLRHRASTPKTRMSTHSYRRHDCPTTTSALLPPASTTAPLPPHRAPQLGLTCFIILSALLCGASTSFSRTRTCARSPSNYSNYSANIVQPAECRRRAAFQCAVSGAPRIFRCASGPSGPSRASTNAPSVPRSSAV